MESAFNTTESTLKIILARMVIMRDSYEVVKKAYSNFIEEYHPQEFIDISLSLSPYQTGVSGEPKILKDVA